MDTRKLITAFLVLAVVTSTVSLFFSAFKKTNSSGSDELLFYGERVGETQTGALAEPLSETPMTVEGYTPTTGTNELATPNPNNLTEVFIYNLAGELVRTNPEGPSLLNGQNAITPPDGNTLNTFLDSYLGTSAFTRVSRDEIFKSIEIMSSHSPIDIRAYTDRVHTILDATVAGPSFERLTEREPSLEAAHATLLLLNEAIEKLKPLSVPEPLADYHSALLTSLLNQRILMQVAVGYETDPVKAIFAARVGSQILAEDAEVFRNETKTLESLLSRGDAKERTGDGLISHAFMNIFGAHKAYAYFGVPSVEVGMSWFQMMLEWVKKIGTEILKNQIVHKLVSQVIKWVQGGGKPQFITNWRDFLNTALNDAAGAALASINTNLCGPFKGIIQAHLRDLIAPSDNIPRCTLNDITNNLNMFYDDFTQSGIGSWVSYSNAARPSANVFGQLFSAELFVGDQALRAKEAADSEAIAGQGFSQSDKKCVNVKNGACVEYETGIPGSVMASITSQAAGSPVDHIVNVQDLEALVSALVDTMLNKITTRGVTLISGSQTDQRTGNTDPVPGDPTFNPCRGLRGADLDSCQKNIPSSAPPPSHFFPTTPPGTPPPPPTACASVPGGTATPPCSTLTPGSPAFDACYAACY